MTETTEASVLNLEIKPYEHDTTWWEVCWMCVECGKRGYLVETERRAHQFGRDLRMNGCCHSDNATRFHFLDLGIEAERTIERLPRHLRWETAALDDDLCPCPAHAKT